MIRITLLDGSSQEIPREEILGLVPLTGLFRHPLLRFEAVLYTRGRVLPVTGPLPATGGKSSGPVETRPWLVLFHDHAQVVHGLPLFDDDVSLERTLELVPGPVAAAPEPESRSLEPDDEEESRLLQEMEELLKSA
jgi:hypothetical protein